MGREPVVGKDRIRCLPTGILEEMHLNAVTSERVGGLSYFTIRHGRQILPHVLTGLEMIVGRRFRVHAKMVRAHHDHRGGRLNGVG